MLLKRPEHDLTSRRKAAIVLTLLGSKLAGEVLKYMTEEQVEALSLEVAKLDKVTPDLRHAIVHEFHDMCMAQDFISEGGVENARRVLESAFGSEKAEMVIRKIMTAMQVVPFEFLKKADPVQLLGFIQDEHPQTIALILAYMPSQSAAAVLTKLPQDLRGEVAERIASMDQVPPEVIRRVEAVLERKVSSLINEEITKAGGPKALVDLLQRVDRSSERLILDMLTDNNPELAEEVKNMMFVFEDILTLDDRAIQAVLKEVDIKELALALKGVSDEVRNKIFKNMSERASNMLKEDMDYMGPVKMRQVEEAQQKVVAIIRRLEEAGEIQIGRGEEDVMV